MKRRDFLSTIPPLLGLPELERVFALYDTQEGNEQNQEASAKHITKFDSEMIPGLVDEQVSFPLSNSRQIVTVNSGHRLVAFDVSNNGLFISYGPPGSIEGSQFAQPLLIVGNNEKGALAEGSTPVGISLARTDKHLYIAWHDFQGVWLASVPMPDFSSLASVQQSFTKARDIELVAPKAHLGDIAIDASGRLTLAYSNAAGIHVATRAGRNWHHDKVADEGSHPVMGFDSRGFLHMAWQVQPVFHFSTRTMSSSRILYAVRNAEGWQPPQLAAHGVSFSPAITVAADQPVIVFQFEGFKEMGRDDKNYLEEREGGGSSIGFAAMADGAWQTGYVSKAAEIIVRDSTVADAFKGRIFPMAEQKWRPKVALDRHGVPWVFWPDTTRRHTYFTRWLGTRFSDECELRGGYYAPSKELTVEKHMPTDAPGLGFAYAAAGRLYFGCTRVPSVSTAETRHILFLDMLEVATVKGVDQKLNRFEKHPGGPIFTPGEPGSWDDFAVSFPSVNYDRGKFRMDYNAVGINQGWGEWQQGYAESEDGIHWTRPKLGLISWNGNRENNLIPWVQYLFDKEELDPDKRYKGVLLSGHTKWIKDFSRPLAYSPDKIHWKTAEQTVDLTCLLEGGGPSLRDDLDIPERRFKAVGRTISQGHRALGMMWSPDLIHWHGKEAVLDVEDPYGKPAQFWRGRYVACRILDPCGEKGGDQIYWGNVWIENGLYLCLYAPFQFDGGYQAAFAVSRDGFNYVRVKNGEFILPRGEAGSWDGGSIGVNYGEGIPLQVNGKIRVYFSAGTSHHGLEPWRTPWSISMAELRSDGWVHLQPSSSDEAGVIDTIPISVDKTKPRRLFINAKVDSQAGSVRVEILDAATNQAVPGYSEGNCHPIQQDSCASLVSWESQEALPANAQKIRLRFYLAGLKTRLYSFWFE